MCSGETGRTVLCVVAIMMASSGARNDASAAPRGLWPADDYAGTAQLWLPVQTKTAGRLQNRAADDFHIPDVSGVLGGKAPMPVQLPPFQSTDYLLLSVRGLPKDFSLSSGFRTSDAWLVSAHQAEGLQIVPPSDYVGAFTLEVRLIRGHDTVARTEIVRVAFKPPVRAVLKAPKPEQLETKRKKAKTKPETKPETEPSVARYEPLNAEKETRLLRAAQTMLDQNDIAAARSIYMRLAQQKSTQGSLRLAQSYDPAFLSQFHITGQLHDLKKARYWYEIAERLGSEDAAQGLASLKPHIK